MKACFGIVKPGKRLGLAASLLVAFCLGCVNAPTRPPALTAPSVDPVASAATAPRSPQIPVPDAATEMLGQVSKERILRDLRRLTGAESICTDMDCRTIPSRLTGSTGLGWAEDYVSRELTGMGYSLKFSEWSNSGYADQNIVARKAGQSLSNEEVYFVAHLDGVKKFWASRFPAADDDASGVVDLLELARVLSNHSFNRTVVLLFSTGEEQGALGVTSYLRQLTPAEMAAIKYAVDVDMIGYDGNRDWAMELWYGGDPSSLALAQRLSDAIRTSQLRLVPTYVVGCG